MQPFPLRALPLLGLLSLPVCAWGSDPLATPSRWVLDSPPRISQEDRGTPRFETAPHHMPEPVADYPTFFELSLADNIAELGYRQTS
ncbi:MAG TPA: hypothetical protein ENJ09_06205, partial [Planctomycetes bacterium]|nr:hypothetical protein [Planctomycetota bacterium]